MSVTYRDEADGSNTTAGTTVTVTVPAGTTDGDLLIAFVARGSSGANISTVPAGWTLNIARDETAGGFSATLIVAWKVWHTGDATTAAFVWGTSVRSVWGCVAVYGYDPDRPFDVVEAQWNASPLPHDSPTLTARHGGGMALMAIACAADVVVSPSGSYTNLWDHQTASISMAASRQATSEGSVGAETFGGTTSNDSITCMVVINADYSPPSLGSSAFSAAVLALSPAGYWRLADETGLTTPDEVGSNDGTYTDGNLLTYAPPIYTGLPAMMALSPKSVVNMDASHHQGHPSYVSLPSVNWWSSNANIYTIMAVFQIDYVASGRQTIFGTSGTGGKPQLEVGTGGVLQMIVEGSFRWQSAAGTIVSGTPYFVVFTRNGTGNTFHVYLNGSEITDASPSTTAQTTGAFVGLIGARTTTTQEFGGRISDLALFTTALSATNASDLYNLLGSTPPAGEPRFDSWWM